MVPVQAKIKKTKARTKNCLIRKMVTKKTQTDLLPMKH